MTYVFHHNKRFTLVDSSSKVGVYCQFFNALHPSRPIPITGANVRSYSCCCLSPEEIYVATLTESNNLHLHTFEGNHFSKPQLIASGTANYDIEEPLLYCIDQTLYMAYLSHQTDTHSYSFIQQNLHEAQMATLYSLEEKPTHIKLFSPCRDISYIFFITHDSYYHLNSLVITSDDIKLYNYLTSPSPIEDYSICLHDQLMHITYVTELHGKYQLCYFNPTMTKVTTITTTLSACKPVIFFYYHTLWINLLLDQRLEILLSIDGGQSFSKPIVSSLQTNLRRAIFYTTASDKLFAQELYISLGTTLKLCTIAMADIYMLHNDNPISPELKLLLEGLSYRSEERSTPTFTAPVSSYEPSKETATPSLEEAKKAFMEELNGWDLPPRV